MFKKRKEKKAQELKAARQQEEQKFANALQEAERMDDPAEKVIALQQLSDSINAKIAGQTADIRRKSEEAATKTIVGSYSTICAGAIGTGIAVAGPLGVGIVMGGIVLGIVGAAAAGAVREQAVEDKLMLGGTEHAVNLGKILLAANDLRDATVEHNVEAISASPLRDRFLSYPALSRKFAEASAKRFVETKETTPEKKPQPHVLKKKTL